MKKNNKKQKGSALVFALILMANAIILVSSMVFLTSIQNKSTGAFFLTSRAFQQADGFLEYALMKINDGSSGLGTRINQLDLCDSFDSGECEFELNSEDAWLWFFDEDDEIITNNSTELKEVDSLKVTAKVQEGGNIVSRSIKVRLFQEP
jgi:hypothetical protein